jgi:glycosyltransferase AglD
MTTSNPSTKTLQVSLVLPAFNEVDYLTPAVEKTIPVLDEFADSYEIIIAEDGSTDGTAERSEELAQKYPCVRHIHREQRLGRGTALNNAFKQSLGEVLVYMDLDLATDLSYLKPLVDAITVEGYDFATGSRMLKESRAQRTFGRNLSSKSYNWLVRQILSSKLYDHQCGFKAFKRQSLLGLLNEVEATHWFWDTEVMVRGYNHGFRIKEIAVQWRSGKGTKVNMTKDSWNMFRQVLLLWWKLKVKRK